MDTPPLEIRRASGLWQPSPVLWRVSDRPIDYVTALAEMEQRVNAIAAEQSSECVWLLEHPALYTAGTSSKSDDLRDSKRFPVFQTGRGGQYTYHGPGQRVAYVMLNLKQRGNDVRAFVWALEDWLIQALLAFNIRGERRAGRIGIWVRRPERGAQAESKIAAIGIRLRRWVSFHGISLNVDPDLEHFSGIVPCGVSEHGVTSLAELGLTATLSDVDIALRQAFESVFGPTENDFF